MKVGNSHSFVVPAAYIRASLIKKDETYEIEIETKHDKLEIENNNLKRKLKEVNALLKEKGLPEIFDEDTASKLE